MKTETVTAMQSATAPSMPDRHRPCQPEPVRKSPSPSGGRPTIYTEALADEIWDIIQATGISNSAAGVYVGISTSTLSRWKAEKPGFALKLQQARVHLQVDMVLKLMNATKKGTKRGKVRAY
jgi:hypothetical protein